MSVQRLQIVATFALLLGIGVGIVYLTSLTGAPWLIPLKKQLTHLLLLDKIQPLRAPDDFEIVDTLFHLAAFGVLTLGLLFLTRGMENSLHRYALIVILIVAFGAIDELHQLHLRERSASWLDFFCDVLGMCWALTIASLRRVYQKQRGRSQQNAKPGATNPRFR